MTYQDQIKSPKWQKKRLEILEARKFKCEDCGDTENQLHVHHILYKKGKKIWDYEDYYLVCLCDCCHTKRHDMQLKILESIAVLEVIAHSEIKDQIYGYLQGLAGPPSIENPSEHFMQGYVDAQPKFNLSEQYMRSIQDFEQ